MTDLQQDAGRSDQAEQATGEEEMRLIAALRAGDESAFARLLDRYHNALVRLALVYVDDRAVAEEVAQETWLGVLQGLGRFEGRSSLKTWIFRILMNTARTRGVREARTIAFSALAVAGDDMDEPAVDPDRFLPPDHSNWPGHWAAAPSSWSQTPEQLLLSVETRAHIDSAIAALPPNQAEVMTLRDIDGWTSEEVCNVLGITETNQRVLLHRARSKVRQALEQYLSEK